MGRRFNIVFPIQSERRRSRTFKFLFFFFPFFIQPAAWFLEMFFCVVAHIVCWLKLDFSASFFFFSPNINALFWKWRHSALHLAVRTDGDAAARKETRGRKDQERRRSERASGWPGEDASGGETCIGSHCASNVITGSDSSVWHAALPICQREIGRVTNGYHCDLPQPPQTPTSRSRVCIPFKCWRGGGGE